MRFSSDDEFIAIGTDPRWLIGGPTAMETLLEKFLSSFDLDELLPSAVALSQVSRQVAVRRALALGIERSMSPSEVGDRTRETIRKRVENVTGLSKAQANRLLNGLGLHSGLDGELERDTVRLVAGYFEKNKSSQKDLPIHLVYDFSLGASETLSAFTLKPFEFVANSAAHAMRLRIRGNAGETEYESIKRVRSDFPPLPMEYSDSAPHQCFKRMAIYGVYIWQAGGMLFESGRGIRLERVEELYSRTIRWVTEVAPWVFPELDSSAKANEARHDPKYRRIVETAVQEVAERVGRALLKVAPFDRDTPLTS